MKLPAFLFVFALARSEAVAEVLRWVDERGVVNYGNAVPERYKDSARAVAIDKPPSEPAQHEVEARLRKAREALARPPAAPTPAGGAEGKAADKLVKKPATRPENPNCEDQWREYDASWACFNPYRTKNGIRGDAFEHCKDVEMPECIRPASLP